MSERNDDQWDVEGRYSFRWGSIVVQREAHEMKYLGYLLTIRTDAGRTLEIRVSHKG